MTNRGWQGRVILPAHRDGRGCGFCHLDLERLTKLYYEEIPSEAKTLTGGGGRSVRPVPDTEFCLGVMLIWEEQTPDSKSNYQDSGQLRVKCHCQR